MHDHDIEGQVSIAVLEGSDELLGDNDTTIPTEPGDIAISESQGFVSVQSEIINLKSTIAKAPLLHYLPRRASVFSDCP